MDEVQKTMRYVQRGEKFIEKEEMITIGENESEKFESRYS